METLFFFTKRLIRKVPDESNWEECVKQSACALANTPILFIPKFGQSSSISPLLYENENGSRKVRERLQVSLVKL